MADNGRGNWAASQTLVERMLGWKIEPVFVPFSEVAKTVRPAYLLQPVSVRLPLQPLHLLSVSRACPTQVIASQTEAGLAYYDGSVLGWCTPKRHAALRTTEPVTHLLLPLSRLVLLFRRW